MPPRKIDIAVLHWDDICTINGVVLFRRATTLESHILKGCTSNDRNVLLGGAADRSLKKITQKRFIDLSLQDFFKHDHTTLYSEMDGMQLIELIARITFILIKMMR
jgi:hypothetical protein